MKMKDIKVIIGLVLAVSGGVAMIVCGIINLGIYVENPDMTGMRRLMEFPWPSVGAVISFIAVKIGLGMIK